jgi:hypothetical protein
MSSFRIRGACIVLALACCVSTGCSFTTMQTSRQLDKGDLVVTGALDWPGFLIIPRVSGQVTYGLESGDISAHAGSSLFTFNAGATARGYLAPWLTGSLQGDIMYLPIDEFFMGAGNSGGAWLMGVTPRLTTATVTGDLFYGGAQSTILFGVPSGGSNIELLGAFFGVIGGLEYVIQDNVSFQVELTVSPLYLTSDGLSSPIAEGGPPVAQIGFGVNWGTGKGSTPPVTDPTPTPRVSPPPEDSRSQPRQESRPQPPPAPTTPPPVYDDDGVPLY